MEKEIIETTKVLSPIIIVIITLVSGIVSALITIYLAPKVKFKYEDKKSKIEYKIELIKNIRNMLDSSKSLEEITASSYWGFIRENLSENEKKIVFQETTFISNNYGSNNEPVDVKLSNYLFRKTQISLMLLRKEKEWKLLD
jgi:uncharacterized membrane protein YgaE (UPF0421/DUF939 family)